MSKIPAILLTYENTELQKRYFCVITNKGTA